MTTPPDNRAFDWAMGDEQAVTAAIEKAAHVVRMPLRDNRIIANPMEPRGCYAETTGDRLHVAVNGQGVWGTKGNLARVLGMQPGDIRVTNPDVGGGFGTKAMDLPRNLSGGPCRAGSGPARALDGRPDRNDAQRQFRPRGWITT